jgi:hypothetical protein
VLQNLRPRGVGEILDAAVALYRARFTTLVSLTVIVVIPVQLINVLVVLSSTPNDTTSTNAIFNSHNNIWTPLAGNLVTTLLTLLGTAFATAAVVRIVSDTYLGTGTPSGRESARFAYRRLGAVLVLTLLVNFLVLAGYALCLIPGIWLQVSLIAAVPSLLLEDLKIGRTLNRSMELVKGRWWQCFAVHYLGAMLTSIVTFSLAALLLALLHLGIHGSAALAFATGVSNVVTSGRTTPFLAAAIVVVYFDLRVRREGFDVQMALYRLDTPAAVA